MSPRRLTRRSGSAVGVLRIALSTIASYLGSSRATLEPFERCTEGLEMIRAAVPPHAHSITSGMALVDASVLLTAPQSAHRYSYTGIRTLPSGASQPDE